MEGLAGGVVGNGQLGRANSGQVLEVSLLCALCNVKCGKCAVACAFAARTPFGSS